MQGVTCGDTHSPLYLASDHGFHVYIRPPNGQTTCAWDTNRYHEDPILIKGEVRVDNSIQPYHPLKSTTRKCGENSK